MRIRVGPGAVIALLGLLFCGDLALHPGQVLYSDYSDLLPLHLPSKRFLMRSWRETGEVPLWCPHNFGGMPFVHDVQSSAFYPPHLPLYVLPEERAGAALSWLVVLHVMAAGWCMYAYACHQGLGPTGAIVAALGYMFSGKWLLHLLAGGHYNMVPLAWLPLVSLWLERAIKEGGVLRATWAGVAFALIILGAYPYLTLYAGLFIAVWTLGAALEEAGCLGSTGRSGCRLTMALGRWVGYGAWTAVVAVGLGAVQLLPSLEAAGEASRAIGVAASGDALLRGLRALTGLVGPALTTNPDCLWEDRVGLGVLWLATAALAPLLYRGRVRFQALVCLILFLFALGGAAATQGLPGFRFFQLPSRVLLLLAVPVSLLAAKTTQALFTEADLPPGLRQRCRRTVLKIAVAVLLLVAVFAAVSSAKDADNRFQFHPYWLTLLVTLPVALWVLGRQAVASSQLSVARPATGNWQLTTGRARALCWIAVLLVDLWGIGLPLVAVRPEAEIYHPSSCIAYLTRNKDSHGRILDFEPAGRSPNGTPLWPGLPMVLGLEPVRGFNPVDVLRYKEYLQLITDKDEPLRPLDRMFTSAVLGTFAIKNQSLADLLGIRYLVQPSELPLEATVLDGEARRAWHRVTAAEDPRPVTFNFIPLSPRGLDCGLQPLPPYSVYENRNVLPRAFIVPEAAPLPDRPAVLPALKAADFRRTVLLEDFSGDSAPQTGARQFRPAVIREYQPNRIAIDVDGSAGYLVLTDIWFPGWTCAVDDRCTPVYRANFLFRAVHVPAGAHQVVFTFAPPSYRWGKLISGATSLVVLLLSLLACVFWLRRAKRAARVHQ